MKYFHFHLDHPTPANFSICKRYIYFSGWAFDRQGRPPHEVRLVIGNRIVKCRFIIRPDVKSVFLQFPEISESVGFHADFTISRGLKLISIQALDHTNKWRILANRIIFVKTDDAPRLISAPVADVTSPPSIKKSIFIVSAEPSFAGHRYRVDNFAQAARSAGYVVEAGTPCSAASSIATMKDLALVVLWRVPWSDNIAEIVASARNRNAKIAFDCDDYMFDPTVANSNNIDAIRSQKLDEKWVADYFYKVRRTMNASDFCISPTKEILRGMSRAGKLGYLLPNGFDDRVFLTASEAALGTTLDKGDVIRVGYAGGTPTHQRDFLIVAPHLAKIIDQRPNVRVVLFEGFINLDEFPSLTISAKAIEWRKPVPYEELPHELARFDINLAPLEQGNSFCEAKSELKYFEAALVFVPTIASPTEPFRESIVHGETGIIAEDHEWEDAILSLVDSKLLRKRLGHAAHRQVLWQFGPERRIFLVNQILTLELGSDNERAIAALAWVKYNRPIVARKICIPDYRIIFQSLGDYYSDVAVIIPLYNYANYVINTLDSLLKQTLSSFDLVIVDDRSTDDSLDVAYKWIHEHRGRFNNISLLQNVVNSKLGPTRNLAFDFTNARFVFPLDADNVLLPKCLERCKQVITESGAAAAYPMIRQFGDSDRLMGTLPWSPARLASGNYIDAMCMIRKSAWSAVGGYEIRNGWEDYDLWLKFVECGLCARHIPEELALYRVHASSMIRTETELVDTKTRLLNVLKSDHPWITHSQENIFKKDSMHY